MFLCLVFLMFSRLFIAALWSPAGKGLVALLLLVLCIVFFGKNTSIAKQQQIMKYIKKLETWS